MLGRRGPARRETLHLMLKMTRPMAGRMHAGEHGTEVTDTIVDTTVVALMMGRGQRGATRPSTRGSLTTGRNTSRASWREAGRSDTPQRADFLAGHLASRAGVVCRIDYLFLVVAASGRNRQHQQKGEFGTGGAALTKETARRNGRGNNVR